MKKAMKKSIMLVMVALLTLSFAIPVCASDVNSTNSSTANSSTANSSTANGAGSRSKVNTTSGSILLDDKAGLLTSSEASQVLEELEVASSKSNCSIAIATMSNGTTESGIQSYANSYYDNVVYGNAPSNYCVLLTIDMSSRLVDVGTYNPGSSQNLSDSEKTEVRKYVTDDLTDGNYVKAFTKYADKASTIAASIDENGKKLKSSFPWAKRILITLVIAAIISILICFIIKSQLKSVTMKANAADYVRDGSMNLTAERDQFLYTTVSKTPRPKNNSSSGGGRSSGSHSTGSF